MKLLSFKLLYRKRKKGREMTLGDLKRCLQKNINITILHETMTKHGDIFDQRRNTFLINLREDNTTKNSWSYYENKELSLLIFNYVFVLFVIRKTK